MTKPAWPVSQVGTRQPPGTRPKRVRAKKTRCHSLMECAPPSPKPSPARRKHGRALQPGQLTSAEAKANALTRKNEAAKRKRAEAKTIRDARPSPASPVSPPQLPAATSGPSDTDTPDSKRRKAQSRKWTRDSRRRTAEAAALTASEARCTRSLAASERGNSQTTNNGGVAASLSEIGRAHV